MTASTPPKPTARPVHLALGSNLGDRLQNLRATLSRLADLGSIAGVAGLYLTAPVGVTNQPPFYNTACTLVTDLSLPQLLTEVKRIEWELGRRPARVWGPRPIDIDILLAGAEVVTEPHLVVPHRRLAERAFVLAPLVDVALTVVHPVLGTSVAQLLAGLTSEELGGVERVSGPEWAARSLDRAFARRRNGA